MATPPEFEVTTADLSSVSLTTTLYQAAIGPVGTQHYLPLFVRFEEEDRVDPGWNWAAAMCTLYWMCYRRLWLAALSYSIGIVSAALLLIGVGRLALQWSEEVQLGVLLGLGAAAFIVPGLWGDALLYKTCRKKVAWALTHSDTVEQACSKLRQRAPSRMRAASIALLQAGMLGIAVLTYLSYTQSDLLVYELRKNTQPQSKIPLPASPENTLTKASPLESAPAETVPSSTEKMTADTSNTLANAVSDTTPNTPPSEADVTLTPGSADASEIPHIGEPHLKLTQVPSTSPAFTAASATASIEAQAPTISSEVSVQQSVAASTTKKSAPHKTQDPTLFYINVGLFVESRNALQTYNKLRHAKLPARQQEVHTSKGKRTRVQVGPFRNEAQAKKAAARIQSLGFDAVLIRSEKAASQTR